MAANEPGRRVEVLAGELRSMGSVCIAFSGGIDSTLLAKVAHDTLGDKMAAITILSRFVPQSEASEAAAWCASEGIRHETISVNELTIPHFSENPPDRCYHCKHALFSRMLTWSEEHGFAALAEGSNVDDEGDYRPGMRAIAELGVRSPLRDAGFSKRDIREAARSLGVPYWNKPSAACLASRIPYGETITAEKLAMVERAEEYLHDQGFSQLRVRMHGTKGSVARIEVPEHEIARLMERETREKVTHYLRGLGFAYVAVDTTGFRSGSMNEAL